MLQVRSLTLHRRDPFTKGTPFVLADINLAMNEGEAVALIGANGSGKSTLLHALAGLITPDHGMIELLDRDLLKASKKEPRWVRQAVGIAFQFPEHGFFAATVKEEIAFTSRMLGWPATQVDEAVERTLELMDLGGDTLSRSPFTLSGGERRRVALAAAIAHDPQLILLDEPEAGLDYPGRSSLEKVIVQLKAGGKAVVVATHDLETAFRWADRCVVLSQGRVQGEFEVDAWRRADDLDQAAPYLWDDGMAGRIQQHLIEQGIDAPSPYLNPRGFVACFQQWLDRLNASGGSDRE